MASNSTLTPVVMPKAKKRKKGEPAHDVTPKDQAFDRNFTRNGKPRLSASVGGKGEGAMGQRR
jgi:CRISPR/Cas system endoribonuclease Cas6 (RAMP superfamily)